jgi:hypothetical protein
MVTMVLLAVVVDFGWFPREVLGTVSSLGVDLLASRNRGSGGLGEVDSYPPVDTR